MDGTMVARTYKTTASCNYSSAADSSDDDSNYISIQDNESINMDSDEEYSPNPPSGNRKYSKRLQSRPGNQFRNSVTSSIASSEDASIQIQRMPTRRPNPKVFNRNALMARENRKKKKEHVESLERDVELLKMENKTLKQQLKKRVSMVHKLRDEKLYLKSVIANKTSIMTLLRTIQGNKIPITSSNLSFVMEHSPPARSSITVKSVQGVQSNHRHGNSCSSPASSMESYEEDEKENDLDLEQFVFPTSSSASLLNDDGDVPLTNWESLLNHDDGDNNYLSRLPLSGDDEDDDGQHSGGDNELSSNVSNEHNYFNNNLVEQKGSASDEPGICLHLSNGRISMEFCASCHRNSQNAWIEEI